MSWSIEFSPLVPLPVLWAVAGLALALAALLAFRRSRGAFLRALSLAAVVLAIANPTLSEEQRESLDNIAVIGVDRSMSQLLGEREAQTAAVLADLEKRLKAIPGLEIRLVDLGRDPAGGDNADGTRLFGDLGRALAGLPADRIAGIFLVTDGEVHDVPGSAAALGVDAPVHALVTGAKGEFDRRIAVLKAPRFGLVGSSAVAEVAVEEHGKAGTAAPVRLTVRREDKPDIVEMVMPGEKVEVPLAFPHAGQNVTEVEIEAAPGELTEANNRVILAAEGVRENLKVLLVSGEPHAGERTWRNLLKSDAAVDLVHFTILRPPQKQDLTPINELSLIAFPTRELFQEKLDEFDLIIFDRYQRRGILPAIYIDNIARFVEEHGGAVLLATGDEYALPGSIWDSPLAQVLPAEPTGRVVEQPFRPELTDLGRRHPVTRILAPPKGAEPGWGRWFRMVDARAPRGETLMTGAGGGPLLVLDRRGKGRVALMLSDHVWLWARGVEGGGPHTQLLRRLSHWLMKEPDLEEERLTGRAEGLKVTIERRTMADTVSPVALSGPGGEAREIVLEAAGDGLFTATIEVKVPGFYRLRQDGLDAVVLAGTRNSREMTEVVATAEPLRPVVEGSGGGSFFTASRPGATPGRDGIDMPRIAMLSGGRLMHGSSWAGVKDRNAHVTTGVTLYPLFNGFAAFAALIGLMSLAWWREGR
ncbi:MAG: hypothetical protein R3D33_04460 [Hyphomicrobiaceae bacterium]